MKVLMPILIWSSMASSYSTMDRHTLRQKFDLIREDCGEVCDTTIEPASG